MRFKPKDALRDAPFSCGADWLVTALVVLFFLLLTSAN